MAHSWRAYNGLASQLVALEEVLVDKMATILWRHRRLLLAEVGEIGQNVSASEKRSHSRRYWSGPVIHQRPLARTQ